MSELLSRRDALKAMAVGAGAVLLGGVSLSAEAREKDGGPVLEGALDDKGTLWVSQKGLPQAYKFGFGHQFRAVANYDKNSDGSSEGITSYEGMLGFAHGEKPGAEVDGFQVFSDSAHPEAFLYFVRMPSYIIPGIYTQKMGSQIQGDGFDQSERGETPPVPGLSDGNYDYWQVAKVELRQNPKTGLMEWANVLEPGETGYVNNLNSAGGPPYDVEGYEFVKEGQYDGGVTIFEYTPSVSR